MPGLNLAGYGGVRAYGTQGNTTNNQPSVTAAAFGSGYSAPQQSAQSALMPNDAGGMVGIAGLVGLAILVFIRHSLPR
jgi:hypothetical protein